jgi:oxygen-dependent protoporphyrinogen oxidase
MSTVAVVGGGVSGLACAYLIRRRLREAGASDVRVRLLEASDRTGGHIRTDAVDGYRCEWGPNGFLDNEPRMLELVEMLGLGPNLVRSNDLARRRFIYRRGALHLLPASPPAFLRTGLIGPLAKARVLMEPLVPGRRNGPEESVASFGRRRLGRAFAEAFLDPMVSGIFAGDIDRLSLQAAFPRMVELERDHGGLFRAMIALQRERKREQRATGDGDAAPRGPAGPGGVLHSLEGGMETLVRTLTDALGDDVRVSTRVDTIAPLDDGVFELTVDGATMTADTVVLASPTPAQARWLRPWEPDVAAAFERVEAAPISVVCLGYARSSITHPLDGFGLLIPRSEGIRTLGVLFTSTLFPARAPEGHVLVRALIGGAHDPGIADLSEAETVDRVRADLAQLLGERAAPVFTRVFRHRRGIPQYNLGHPDVVVRADGAESRHPGLSLTGNWLRGISMNLCVKDAFRVADRVVSNLAAPVT